MFKYLFNKVNAWFSRITSPISYNEKYLLVSEAAYALIPENFSKIHSSNFNTLVINCYSKTLEEYNEMSIYILESIKKGKKPNVIFSNIFKISLPDFFLSKKGNFCIEADLITNLQKNVASTAEWLINYEMQDGFSDSSMEYMFIKRLHDSNIDVVNVLSDAQKLF